jgi:hypothetical protein
MEATGDKYKVEVDTHEQVRPRRRSSALLKHIDDKRTSWVDATESAIKILETERNERRSFLPYFGIDKKWQRKLRIALSPSPCEATFQLLWLISFHCLATPFVYYLLMQRIILSAAFFLVGLNVVMKVITIGENFRRDDNIASIILRMVGEARKKNFLTLMSRPLGFLSGTARKISSALSLVVTVCLIALYFLQIHTYSVPVHACIIAFWVLLIAPMLPQFPISIEVITNYFTQTADALAIMINEFEVYDTTAHSSGFQAPLSPIKTKLNFERAYENYHIMTGLIEQFSEAFAGYFFYAEFTLALATLCLLFAAADAIANAINTGGGLLSIFVTAFAVSNFVMYILCCCRIFFAAATITESVRRVENRVHRLEAIINVVDPSLRVEMKTFSDHILRGLPLTGFRSMGIIVSKSLGTKITYAMLTILSTAAMYGLRVADKLGR